MDAAQLQQHLDQLSDEQLEDAADELTAYVTQRRKRSSVDNKGGKGSKAAAPFNAKNFFANFLKVVQTLAPVIGPMIGLDTQGAQSADAEEDDE